MKSTITAIIMMTLAAGTTGRAQDTAEYSHAVTQSATSLQEWVNRYSGSLQKPAAQGGRGPLVQNIGPAKSGPMTGSAAKPAPPALFVFSDGKQLESSHYVLTAQNVIIQDGPKAQTIPLTAIDREATVTANRKRGLDLKFPDGSSQMTISF
jgi:hypothetical protein